MADCYLFYFDSLFSEKLHCCNTKNNTKNGAIYYFAVPKIFIHDNNFDPEASLLGKKLPYFPFYRSKDPEMYRYGTFLTVLSYRLQFFSSDNFLPLGDF